MSLISNAKWNSISQLFKIGIQLVNVVYLAKIIPPTEYGIMAMALVILNLGILLRDLGTSAAIIQKKTLNHNLINTVFWLNTLMGCVLAIITCLTSPLIAKVYNQPELIPVLIMLSITFPLSSCAAAHLALMERESRFKKVSMIEVSSALTSVIFAVVLANIGYGVYSLVVQAIVLSLMSAVQFWRASTWRPSFKNMIDIDEIKGIIGFSANLSLFNFINYFSRNSDNFMIGKYMSATILGCYSLAYRIMLFPLQSLTFIVTRSLYPVLSQHQDDTKKISQTYLNCVFIIVLITAPLMSGLAILSTPFIILVFGHQWILTASILKWLAPTAIIQSVLSTSGSVFMARGRTDILMKLGILGAFLQVGSFIIGVNFDITTFAMLYFSANIINFFPVMYYLLKTIGENLSSLLKKITPVILSTIIMVFFLLFVKNILLSSNKIENTDQLIWMSVSGAMIYFISIFILSAQIRCLVRTRKI
ncbi:PST family polysaccharide transporter [Gibbsiella quercinecans]|uniref:Polysaccharide biosynthesis protein n=1 Tax=Gibbsiella quercinecans TaxID=929813 RepID=A0A250AXL0_9GAMM|nr:MOP flippase family protein [Gibbsiella quercinecans]ATA18611.1 polysaccharide biosynthesis protein [Gibbsiella quercinecans]RLM02321.1 lipopolysaccharide biosynthesis protein [Gibbsiella quercinecans]TCT80031.1 PST family polysaccharide transporter [Gibbsiella quercinecans]